MLKQLFAVPDRFYTPDRARLSLVAYAFLVLLCLGFFTPGIVAIPPMDRDESSFAQASKQMIETGNYVDIRLQNKPRYNKPIGIYWLQSASAQLLSPQGLNEIWAYRVPSFIGATVSVLMTAALGSVLFNATTGLLAAMMLAGCLLLGGEARLAKTDAALLAFLMTALYAMARAYKEKLSGIQSRRFFLPFLFWTALAGGILIKGPIALLPVLGILLWVKLFGKDVSWFRRLLPLIGLLYALALTAPWFIAILAQSGVAFLEASAGRDMLAKIWEGQNRGFIPPGMHLTALPVLFFPFSLFVAFAIPDIWKNRKEESVRFCLGWIVPLWIVFEMAFTKLPHYVLPAYPAIALLTAKSIAEGFPWLSEKCRRFPVFLITGAWILIGAAVAFLLPLAFFLLYNRLDLPLVLAGLVVILCQHAGLFLFIKDKIASFVVMSIGAMVFSAMICGYALPQVPFLWTSNKIVEKARIAAGDSCASPKIISAGYAEPSLVFLAGTDTRLATGGAEAAGALKTTACGVAVIDKVQNQAFMDAFAAAETKPLEAGTLTGVNAGKGSMAYLTFYILPKERK